MNLGLEQAWRWFGPNDPIPLDHIKMAGATGIVTALHHIPNGEIWTTDEILKRKTLIQQADLRWSVVESIPVHEDIKKRTGNFQENIDNYKQSIQNLGAAGIDTVCYNFMPVLDWTRTDLSYMMPDGSRALRFDALQFAVFDIFLLERDDAASDYSKSQIEAAHQLHKHMTTEEETMLVDNIIAGLPGAEEGYSLTDFQAVLDGYRQISATDLRRNLISFLEEITTTAEQSGVRLALHPDDPPFPILGLPRVVSTEDDLELILRSVDSPANGLCFCTGSLGVRADNDLVGMINRLGPRINFIHLRSTRREQNAASFHEADHLTGDVDMYAVIVALIEEQSRRIKIGRSDYRMPMRPDHGHQMLDDLSKRSNPGYSAIGRLRGLAELRGLEWGIRAALST